MYNIATCSLDLLNLQPHAGSSVTISSHVLLDESPPELDHIQIEANGRLVWSPSANITLKVRKCMAVDTDYFPP